MPQTVVAEKKSKEIKVGKMGMKSPVFAGREWRTNYFLLKALALEGPTHAYNLWTRIRDAMREEQVEQERFKPATIYFRLKDLERRGYVQVIEERAYERIESLKIKTYDLTRKGVIAACLIPSVRERLPELLKWKLPDGRPRLWGGRTIKLMIENRIGKELFSYIVMEVAKKLILFDIETIPNEELEEYGVRFTGSVMTNLLRHRDFHSLKVSKQDIQRYRSLILNNPEAKKDLEEIYSRAIGSTKVLLDGLEKGFKFLQKERSITLRE